jgi:hypothetical protein
MNLRADRFGCTQQFNKAGERPLLLNIVGGQVGMEIFRQPFQQERMFLNRSPQPLKNLIFIHSFLSGWLSVVVRPKKLLPVHV